ncbi:PilZ domain-containing protein [Paenibacillus septentrionalis]|uniref:PilZ domain-containing protein n=1 Tax=Paenibacillus septentrionalis TaxID=429342 RepID=A0ABW1V7E7_9BACL
MIINRRKTPFRYELKEAVAFELQFLSINGMVPPQKPVLAYLYNINRAGCRIWMPLSLPIDNSNIAISMNIVLNNEPITLKGVLRWSLPHQNGYYYGIELDASDQERERLPAELRELAGQNRILAQ